MVEIKELSFSYEDHEAAHKALNHINLTINEGEFVGIIGPSGAGKSTLMMALNGIVPHFYNQGAFYGTVKVLGEDTVELNCHELSKSVGSVLQDPDTQMVTSKVEDEIAFALENQGLDREIIEERITESLELCGITYLRNRKTTQLSGGQMQRVAIAAAIAQKPKILVLDEPTSELDPAGSTLIFETLKSLNEKQKMTIVIVEQKVMLLASYCSRILVMNNGEVVLEGQTRQVLESYKRLEELGINCPRVVKLASRLREEDFHINTMPITVEEAALMLRKLE